MKVSIVSESPADSAVLEIFVNALTRRHNEIIAGASIRPGGWSGAINAIDKELRRLHYNTDAHALIAVVDSDDTPVHDDSHDQPNGIVADCRLCKIFGIIQNARSAVGRRPFSEQVKVAVGLAVPALEAWLLFGKDPHIVEAKYERDYLDGVDLRPARVQLKKRLYGTPRPSKELAMRIAIEAARHLANDLMRLEQGFPKGFGLFARQIRTW